MSWNWEKLKHQPFAGNSNFKKMNRRLKRGRMLDIGAFGLICIIVVGAELFSIPFGLYTAIKTESLFHGLASVFVPFYGMIYGTIHHLF